MKLQAIRVDLNRISPILSKLDILLWKQMSGNTRTLNDILIKAAQYITDRHLVASAVCDAGPGLELGNQCLK